MRAPAQVLFETNYFLRFNQRTFKLRSRRACQTRAFCYPICQNLPPSICKKAARKQRSQAEVDQVIGWLTGYDQDGFAAADCRGR